ncbi:MAG: peptide deformylase [Eubacteriales bacterium]|nr:peptide deformylase [Eubacteriales bacterium]MDD4324492.1 peptide deformylase [Eubacteriales bacterium]MDD4541445.1 peptide deformylase [Eubacteriales bacterium]
MALRNVLLEGDGTLRKKSREVTHFDQRTRELIDDMFETMREEDGLGLAAPQVGVLKRIFVMEGVEDNEPTAFINPVLIDEKGEQTGAEGCLSLPGLFGIVTRPEEIRVRAQDISGEEFERTYTGLEARCVCHEIDHLYGVLYRDKAEGGLHKLEPEEEQDETETASEEIISAKVADSDA